MLRNLGRIQCGHVDYNVPTDLFYACFGAMDWDKNGNGIYAQATDKVVLDQNICVTRLPVDNISEVSNYVNRVILYERGNSTNDNYRLLMCGTKMYFYTNGMSDAQYFGGMMLNYITPYYNGNIVRFYDTYTDIEGGNHDFNADNLQMELSTDSPILFMSTHGDSVSWEMAQFGEYNTSDALNLENDLSTLLHGAGTTHIITSSCYTNAFDLVDTCLSEAFINNPNSGVLTYLGSSRAGIVYTIPSNTLAPSDFFNAKYLEDLFKNKNKRFGEVVATTKAFCKAISHTGNYRWLLFSTNPIGDPELPIFTEAPDLFSSTNVSYQNGILSIETGVDSCTICVTSRDDNGNSYFDIALDTSYASFSLPTNIYNICITKAGYAPHVEIFSNTPYVQNDTLNLPATIVADNVSIGSNVTTTKVNGPVTIESGKTTINVNGATIIKNDFKVQNGAELLIETGF